MKKGIVMMLLAFIVLFSSFLIASGIYLPKRYDGNDDVYNESMPLTKTQFRLIHGGLQAASSHNMQPWKIKIVDTTTFELHADMDKTLPVIDPQNHQLLLSQGTFLQSLEDTADRHGIVVSIESALIDWDSNATKIATITIENEVASDIAAFAGASTPSFGDGATPFTVDAAEDLFSDRDDIHRTWIEGDDLVAFQDLLLEATVLEGRDEAAMKELLNVFRFTRYAKNKNRFGLSLNTMGPFAQMFLEPILMLSSSPLSFGQSSIGPFEARLKTEHTYLILSMDQPDAWDYVELGRLTQRLSGAFPDVVVRPAVQLLEPLDGMDFLLEAMITDFHVPGVPVIILGFQTPQEGPHESIRHRVTDLLG